MKWFVSIAEWIKRRYFRIPFDSTYHPAEAYYASIYMDIINSHLAGLGREQLNILEAGCGTGRIMLPLALSGHKLLGIDRHRDSLRIARENIMKAGVEAEIIDGDLAREMDKLPAGTFDAALSIEVLYSSDQQLDMMSRMCVLLRKDGLLFIAHRTRYYYLMQSLANKNFKDAYLVATSNEGRLLKGHHRIFYNWQSSEDLDNLYSGLGMRILRKHPIGPYSGFTPDPIETVCDPGSLTNDQREILRKIEMELFDPETMMASRYILVVAQKQ